ncbi:RNA-directed DNA polymerase, eukaryota, reverse transcriptase zinc-binding domain protein [Tanacetum coccineum]
MSTGNKQKEEMEFIKKERLHVCAIIETHIKAKKVKDVCGKVTRQSIFYHIEGFQGKVKFFCSFVYASNSRDERKSLWKEMFMHKRISDNHLWVLLGDMNVTLNTEEHSCSGSHISEEMQDFRDCINSIEFEDIGSSESHAIFQPFLISDYSPALLIITSSWKKKARSFRFANYIADKPEFIKEIEEGWKAQFHGYKMYCLTKKLKHIKPILNKMNWKNGDLTVKVEMTRVKLQEAQSLIKKNPHNCLIKERAVQALNDYNEAMIDEEKLLAQKTRINWLNEGDKNSACFYKVIKGRRSRNRVDVNYDEKGDGYEKEEVPTQFVKHFQQFLGNNSEVSTLKDCEGLFSTMLNQEEAEDMIREVSNNEIKEAMFDIGDNRAPGPDRYSSLFFKKAWSTVGSDVCFPIKEFFESGQMLGEINATLITLVPKIQTPIKVSDFRPIACCNMLYKCISKIITNRIKSGLKKLVQINQSAFIPGRVILDNILLSQEILRGYGRQHGPKRCAMKIDLQNAYDTINWDFLEFILKKFGFHHRMVGWIMKCVRSADSLCVLMEKGMDISKEAGIRVNDCFRYHHGCKELKLVNLCFADDLMIFCNGDPLSVGLIKEGLNEFSEISGLFPNLNKSTLFFGSLKDTEKEQIMNIMQFKEGTLADTDDLFAQWRPTFSTTSSSMLGRHCIIATVLESMSVYWASVFRLPKTVVKEINNILKRFLWSNGDSAKGKAKIAWKYVCRPKECGGLGIKNLES